MPPSVLERIIVKFLQVSIKLLRVGALRINTSCQFFKTNFSVRFCNYLTHHVNLDNNTD